MRTLALVVALTGPLATPALAGSFQLVPEYPDIGRIDNCSTFDAWRQKTYAGFTIEAVQRLQKAQAPLKAAQAARAKILDLPSLLEDADLADEAEDLRANIAVIYWQEEYCAQYVPYRRELVGPVPASTR